MRGRRRRTANQPSEQPEDDPSSWTNIAQQDLLIQAEVVHWGVKWGVKFLGVWCGYCSRDNMDIVHFEFDDDGAEVSVKRLCTCGGERIDVYKFSHYE